ncbi:7-carboxy-7-deazaguanine synthase [Marinomonas algicola]|uniref:7-carboxy-7-deazaguanine synthase n=1 Tax=Marinomonas algicola TaxID=2773454 RepID=UPI00174A798E|nr:7-carboxy-7-deazaguanine synthase [Marinomonas algicola]
MYSIKEAFYSLQGEGAHSGRPSIFCRFTGCNLWSGKELHRLSSDCQFCDTDFIGTNGQNGGRFTTAANLANHLNALWPAQHNHKYVVFTGGEPALQLDNDLVESMHSFGFEVAIETNGTLPIPDNIDWICVSPKTEQPLKIDSGNELKLVYPQKHLSPERFESLKFDHFYLQPMDQSHLPLDKISPESSQNLTLDYCLCNPRWRLSLQTHKMLNID